MGWDNVLSHWLLRSLLAVMNPHNMWNIPNFYAKERPPSILENLLCITLDTDSNDEEAQDNDNDGDAEEAEEEGISALSLTNQINNLAPQDNNALPSPPSVYVKTLESTLQFLDSLILSSKRQRESSAACKRPGNDTEVSSEYGEELSFYVAMVTDGVCAAHCIREC